MKILFVSSILAIFMCACSQGNASSTLDDIHTAVDAGDFALARKMCANLAENDTSLTASQLMQLAIAYVRIADDADDIEDMASAAKCYNMAFLANPDSAMAYINTLPPAQQTQLRLLADVSFGVDDFELGQDLEAESSIDPTIQ